MARLPTQMTVTVGMRLTVQHVEALDRLARERGATRSGQASAVLTEWIEREESKRGKGSRRG